MARRLFSFLATALFVLIGASAASAQSRPALVEGNAGYAGFVDESFVHHFVLGASGRAFVSRHIAIGPEVTWMRGPDGGRRWFVTANATIDLGDVSAARVAVPYVVVGGGLMRHTDLVGTGFFTSTEPTFTGGVGVRLTPPGSAWYLAPEFRVGGEGHFRIGAVFGTSWR